MTTATALAAEVGGVGGALSIEIESLSVEAKFVYDVVVTTSS